MIKEVKIGDYCLVGDGTHSSIKRIDSGVMYLSSKNFSKEGMVLEKVDYISEEDYPKYFKESSTALTKPKEDDLLFSIIGSIGGVYLYKKDDNFGLSSSVAMLRVNSKELDAHYIFYYLKSTFLQKWAEIIKSGSAQGFLSLAMIRGLPLILPPLKTQKKIASILSNYDKLIENNNQRIKLLESMAEEIYKEWFVRLRFPDFDKVEILDGVPFGWKEKKIKDFGVVITGKTPSTTNQKYYGGNIPFIKTPDMRKYPYVDSSNEYLTKEGANSQNNKFLDKNTLIVGCIGSKAGAYSLVQEKSQTNQQINAIKFFKDEYTFYMYNFASNFSVILNLLGNSGSTMTNVNKSKFENIDVLMPSFEVLSQYHLIVKDNFEIILNLQQKNKNLKETRDLLLPKLIHGTLKI